ncbi:hypothetical protein ACWG0P_14015 [Amedibacillus sp. YH-ame6]
MDKLLEKFLEDNFTIACTVVVVACLLLSGGTLVYVSDRSLFMELDLFKLMFMAITPSMIIFSLVFVMSIAYGLGDDNNAKRIIVSAVLAAMYNFVWSYIIFMGIANGNYYVHSIAISIATAVVIVVIAFIKDTKRNT